MPSFADSIFLFVLALLLFGPKKLPVLARELGKWMGEFRRASNEFKMQMDDELRASEQADRQKQITAMEAAAPIPPPLNEPTEPEHPHMRHSAPAAGHDLAVPSQEHSTQAESVSEPTLSAITPGNPVQEPLPSPATPEMADGVRPMPIATSGSLKMMPPATGLPTPRDARPNALAGLVDSIPEASANGTHTQARSPETESAAHGD